MTRPWNGIIAGPNYLWPDPRFASVTASGGLWRPEAPASAVLGQRTSSRARSITTNPQATQLWLDLGMLRDVRVVALPFCNGTLDAMLRLRAYDAPDPAAAVLADTGWIDLYREVYPLDTLDFEHASFWDGKMTAEDAARVRMPWWQVFADPVVAQFWRLEIFDPDNPAGFIEVPPLFICPGWQASVNFDYGASVGVTDPSPEVSTWSGRRIADPRPQRRVMSLKYALLPEDEALSRAFDLQTVVGQRQPVFVIWNPLDTQHAHRRAFPALLRNLSPIEASFYRRAGVSFALEEWL